MSIPSESTVSETSTSLLIIFSSLLGLSYAGIQFIGIQKKKITSYTRISNENEENHFMDDVNTTNKLTEIYNAITEGAIAFLMQEYNYMLKFMIGFGLIVFVLTGSANNCGSDELTSGKLEFANGSCWINGLFTTISFVLGCLTSMLSGYLGMRIAVFSNVRTTIGAQQSWKEAFNTAFRGGAVIGFSLCSLALLVLYICITLYHIKWGNNKLGNYQVLFECIAGYGLGGSSIALFGRVGGGIYTKAADVGADLVGKVEQGIPEDDPRNPGVIADNVGDNVGDVAGMGSDLFGSFAEATCAALVISSVSPDLNSSWSSMMFPLLISSVGILTCIVTSTIPLYISFVNKESDVEKTLKNQLIISTVLVTGAILAICLTALPSKYCVLLSDNLSSTDFNWYNDNPVWCDKIATNYGAFASIISGLWSGLIIGYFTEYMTSHSYKPVQEIAEVSNKGAAVNIIYGLALGQLSTIVPSLCLAISIYVSFHLCHIYGISLAALGMLSTLAICLTIDCYGPISDNAGGIAEMAGLDDSVRDITDALDSAGNTTAAIGKGFAIGSAALVSLALFGAYVTRIGLEQVGVNILNPITFSGLIIGAMLPYWFSAMTMKSVGKAAQEMVEEVRRQFKENPEIMTNPDVKPDYARCVQISTESSLREMILPGLLVILSPIILGFLFGVNIVTGLLVGGMVSGVQIAISSSNSGGAWDNAKKFIEKGNHGGKGTDIHAATVIGDTVGDPLKDTSGPAINILMKLMAIISVVFANFFLKNSLPALIDGYNI